MTPIDFALAKAAGAIMNSTKDKVLTGTAEFFAPKTTNTVKSLVNGFQALGEIKEVKNDIMEFEDEYRDKKRRDFDLEIARKRVKSDFSQIIESMNPIKSKSRMKLVANRIKTKRKRTKGKKK